MDTFKLEQSHLELYFKQNVLGKAATQENLGTLIKRELNKLLKLYMRGSGIQSVHARAKVSRQDARFDSV